MYMVFVNVYGTHLSQTAYVTQFWKTILFGTLVNFLFYSLNEALGVYLSCAKISA